MKKLWSIILLLGTISLTSCDSNEEISYQDITVNFAATEIGIDESHSEAAVSVTLSRTTNTDLTVVVSYTANDVVYGTDFTINPQPVDHKVELIIAAGNTSASFTVEKVADVLFDGNETIDFVIASIEPTSGFRIGDNAKAVLSFS